MNAVFLFIPLMVMGGELQEVSSADAVYQPKFWALMTLAGLFGLLLTLFPC